MFTLNLPVHKSNLIPHGIQVDKKTIHIRQSYYGEQLLEVWKKIFGPWYRWVETRKLDEPNSEDTHD